MRAKPHDDATGYREATRGSTDGRKNISASPAMSTRLPRKRGRTRKVYSLTEQDLANAPADAIALVSNIRGYGQVQIRALVYIDESRIEAKEIAEQPQEPRKRRELTRGATELLLPVYGDLAS
jgi:hypothetical protein